MCRYCGGYHAVRGEPFSVNSRAMQVLDLPMNRPVFINSNGHDNVQRAILMARPHAMKKLRQSGRSSTRLAHFHSSMRTYTCSIFNGQGSTLTN